MGLLTCGSLESGGSWGVVFYKNCWLLPSIYLLDNRNRSMAFCSTTKPKTRMEYEKSGVVFQKESSSRHWPKNCQTYGNFLFGYLLLFLSKKEKKSSLIFELLSKIQIQILHAILLHFYMATEKEKSHLRELMDELKKKSCLRTTLSLAFLLLMASLLLKCFFVVLHTFLFSWMA